MQQPSQHLIQARALQADILAAPDVWLPRREILLEWLAGFTLRASAPAYDLGETEEADLNALGRFLRSKKIPVSQA